MEKKEQSRKSKLTRRLFIGAGGLVGVGLVTGLGGLIYLKRAIKKYSGLGMGEGHSLNAWIRIAPDNTITLAVPRAEMGQGVYTALPQLIAEELEIEFSKVRIVHPQPESPYSNIYLMTQEESNFYKGYTLMETIYSFLPIVGTGGSTSVADGWNNLRYAGATAREMLIRAAAQKWNIDANQCRAENGIITNTDTGDQLFYGALAEEAAFVKLKTLPTLKKRRDFKVIGKPVHRLDIPDKVNGSAVFGLDVRPDGLLFAAVRHPKTIGGKIQKITNEQEISSKPGIRKVLISEYGPAIVIADNTWRAIMAAKALDTEEDGANDHLSSKDIESQLDKLLEDQPLEVRIDQGKVDEVLDDAGSELLEARYDVPYLAHATMEPMNCTVRVDGESCECWVGHQAASVVHNLLNESTGIKKDQIKINITYLGGGFGRRAEPDFIRYAGAAAKAMPGVPVQTVFSREEDMQNDMYRPVAACTFKAKINPKGDIEAWDNMLAMQSVENDALMRIMPSMATAPEDDEQTVEGVGTLPYAMKNQRVAFANLDVPIQVGFWRSVGHSQNSFFAESFMDECAHAIGMDPYLFRKEKLPEHPRHVAVLDQVASMSGWGTKMTDKFQGMALVKSFGSIVGQVVELSQKSEKEFKIDRVYCAVDCGNYVNPSIIEAQIQGGIIFGLSAALYGEITWSQGSVDQLNFPQYEMVRLKVCPEIDVHIMDVDAAPGGIGEPGTPPIAPALTNALFAATGERIRRLPLQKAGYHFV